MVDAEAGGIALAFLKSYLPALLEVGLISDYNNWQAVAELVSQLLHPHRHLLEAVDVGDVVHNQGTL